jgi:hypothetical protein
MSGKPVGLEVDLDVVRGRPVRSEGLGSSDTRSDGGQAVAVVGGENPTARWASSAFYLRPGGLSSPG